MVEECTGGVKARGSKLRSKRRKEGQRMKKTRWKVNKNKSQMRKKKKGKKKVQLPYAIFIQKLTCPSFFRSTPLHPRRAFSYFFLVATFFLFFNPSIATGATFLVFLQCTPTLSLVGQMKIPFSSFLLLPSVTRSQHLYSIQLHASLALRFANARFNLALTQAPKVSPSVSREGYRNNNVAPLDVLGLKPSNDVPRSKRTSQ